MFPTIRKRESKKSEWNLFNSFNPFDIVYRFLSISIDSPLFKTRTNKKAFHPPPLFLPLEKSLLAMPRHCPFKIQRAVASFSSTRSKVFFRSRQKRDISLLPKSERSHRPSLLKMAAL